MAFNNLYVNWRYGLYCIISVLFCTMTHNAQGYPSLKAHTHHARNFDEWPALQELLGENPRFSIESDRLTRNSDANIMSENVRLFNTLMRGKNVKRNIMLRNNGTPVRAYSMKKNIQYMSPCHFKICNMGKRLAPDYSYY